MTSTTPQARPSSVRSLLVPIGTAAGFVTPIVTIVFLAAAQWFTSHSNLHDEMSNLGDSETAAWGYAFEFVQYATAVLIALFAVAFYRKVPSGRIIVALLTLNVIGTVLLGQARCRSNRTGTFDCEPIGLVPGLGGLHQWVVFGLGMTILFVLGAAVRDLRSSGPYGLLQKVSGPLLALAIVGAVAFVLLGDHGSEADSSIEATNNFRGLAERTIWAAGYIWLVIAAALLLRNQRNARQPSFDHSRLQQNVAFGNRRLRAAKYLAYDIDDADGFREWLREALGSQLIRSERTRWKPQTAGERRFTISLAISRQSLDTLGLSYRWRAAGVDDSFGAGMANRFEHLGDPKSTTALDDHHVLLWVMGEDQAAIDEATQLLAGLRKSATPKRTITAVGNGLADAKEPFGWRDGISNPWIRGLHSPSDTRRQGGGKVTDRGFQQIELGEFLLGEIDEAEDVMPVPEPSGLFFHGTFLVLRQLEQDAPRFNDLTKALASRSTELEPDDAGDKLMGRRKDGTPLASARDHSDPSDNDFLYFDDPEGLACPVGAHIRRSNPRDSLGLGGIPSHRHRIIRRGTPYRKTTSDGSVKEGLVFVCLNARPADQFDFIQVQWLNDGEALRQGRSPDPIAGTWNDENPRTIVVPGSSGPAYAMIGKPLTRTICGGYFLLPSMSGLAFLARSPIKSAQSTTQ